VSSSAACDLIAELSNSPPRQSTDAAPAGEVDRLRSFTTEDIDSFKALGGVRYRPDSQDDDVMAHRQ
jgi:hypothetical protein